MSRPNCYKWLIVVEGSTDANTYYNLLVRYGINKNDFSLFSAQGIGFVCNSTTWEKNNLLKTIKHDIGRKDFVGIILLVDADSDNNKAFDSYKRNDNLPYANKIVPNKENKGVYWHLDDLNGSNKIPIYGISVPVIATGCLETDLLASYGFPVEGQPEYSNFVDIIKKTTDKWQVSEHKDDKKWWEENSKAKLDKFIYHALSHGFYVSRETPGHLPEEPNVIKNIKSIIEKL